MALSPLDIHNKEFNVRMRGYDQDQVNDFLSQIIKDYSALLKDNEDLQKQLDDAQEKVKYFTDLKDALNQSIIVAQEAADKVKTNAEQEADLIQQQAEKNAQDLLTSSTDKANRIVGDASEKAKKITVETEDLKRQTRVFRQRLQVMLESQLEVVKSPEWKELLSTSDASSVVLDPANSESNLDKPAPEPVHSEATEAVDDAAEQPGYTEIIFPQESDADDAEKPAATETDTEE